MSRFSVVSIIMVLAALGLADSIYLSYTALSNTALNCSIDGLDGCNIVAQSAYARVLGIPLAVYGVAFYSLILATGLGLRNPRSHTFSTKALLVFSTLGVLCSLYFMYVQVFLIQALCIYCAGSFLASLLIWVYSIRYARSCRARTEPTVPSLP